jgi:hypothetical protein
MTRLTRRAVLAAFGTGAVRGLGRDQTADRNATYGAWLVGSNEVPSVETDAFGFAVFRVGIDERSRVGPDERWIDYWLVVADIDDVTESHIHKGPPDLNGNVVAYLFGPAQEPVTKTGLLSAGTLTDGDMIWPLTDVAGMVEQMRAENVYVNVHTTEHPAGEIRGQIRPLGTPLSG